MKFFTLNRKEDAATEPVTLDEARAQLRMAQDETNEDEYITDLIKAARQAVEELLHRSLITQTWEAGFTGWDQKNPARPTEYGFELPRPKTIFVESVEYWDENGVKQTMPNTDYVVDLNAFPAILRVKKATYLPALSPDLPAPILITYVAGFGTADDVPAPIKRAILLTISHFFDIRCPVSSSVFTRVPDSAQALLGLYKLRNV